MTRIYIDVRESAEYDRGHVEGAINIPPSELVNGAEKLRNIPKDAELILYCVTGSRSAFSSNLLKEMGYTNVVNGINRQQVESKYGI